MQLWGMQFKISFLLAGDDYMTPSIFVELYWPIRLQFQTASRYSAYNKVTYIVYCSWLLH